MLVATDPQLKAQLVVVLCCLLFLLQVRPPLALESLRILPWFVSLTQRWCRLRAQILLRPFAVARSNTQEAMCLFALCLVAALADHTSLDHRMSLGVQLTVSLLVFGVSLVLAASWAPGAKRDLRVLCGRCFPSLVEQRAEESSDRADSEAADSGALSLQHNVSLRQLQAPLLDNED